MPSNSFLFFGAKPEIFEKARQLRQNMTQAEEILWTQLKNRKFMGLKFRRQHPISHFIVEFYCPQEKLVIEIDGSVHEQEDQKEYDGNRTKELRRLGLRELRFNNEEIEKNCKVVLDKIKDFLDKKI